MSYSGPLDPTAPGQGEFARLGASRIRALTLAIKERLASLFVNPDADPLKFKLPVMAALTIDYTFPSPTTVLGGFSNGVTVPVTVPAGATIPDNSPTFVNWKDTDAGPIVAAYSFHSWYVGGNFHFHIYNPTGSSGTVSNKTLKLTIFYPATP